MFFEVDEEVDGAWINAKAGIAEIFTSVSAAENGRRANGIELV